MKASTLKNSLVRFAFILIIIAGIATVGINLLLVQKKIGALQSSLRLQIEARQTAETGWNRTKADLTTTTASLNDTRKALGSATAELQKMGAEVAAFRIGSEKLSRELKRALTEQADARAEVSRFESTGLTPEQILTVAADLKSLRAELRGERTKNATLTAQVEALTKDLPPDQPPSLPAGLRAKVLVADPKWQFVVLDAGKDQGVLKHGEVLISRNGKLVAKARISRVEQDRSVANLLPGWEFGEVLEGDLGLAANARL